ncbi:MAG: universal stress protein [Anaerolineales bacterium]|nr:universal stress protein [Anaerolineales bacterium]
MGVILCATRGGEASYGSQQAAIALAKQRGDEIVFLYIVNLDFLDKTSAPIVVDIENELEQMARFFLLMAEERAAEQGVIVHTIIRKGEVQKEIIQAALDEKATLVVLGRPAGKLSAFKLSSLEEFMREIEEVTGAETALV